MNDCKFTGRLTSDPAEENNQLAKELDPAYVDKTYEEQCREFVIKDNVSGGEWDWDLLANVSKVDNDKALENLKVYIEDLWRRYESR